MNEAFLHFVWQYQLFDNKNIKALSGEKITVVKQGFYNTNSGPDFSMAQIYIDKTLWSGNIEIHLKTSDWYQHQHQNNKKYSNIILHVVLENDLSPEQMDAIPAPTLEIKSLIFSKTYHTYQQINESRTIIPCQNLLPEVDDFRFRSGLHRLLIERISDKTQEIFELLENTQNNWEETMYQSVAYTFGLKINAFSFLLLAKSLPLKIIAKHKNSLFQIEALLFGQSGMLDLNWNDAYPKELKKEYLFLAKKYQLTSLKNECWHFMRLRPAAFPTIRIAQFAYLLFKSQQLFSKIKATPDLKNLFHLFDTEVSEYWLTHYRFDSASKKQSKKIGKSSLQIILQNSVVPVLFAYGITHDNEAVKSHALFILENLPAEKNNIMDMWTALGRTPKNASESQALLQLKNQYCSAKKCLQCHVGVKLLKPS